MSKYKLEMLVGQDQRQVEADSWTVEDGWIIFWRLPAVGGPARRYWLVQKEHVVSMEILP